MKFKPLAHVAGLAASLALAATLGAGAAHAQDAKNRIIRFGYGLNEMSNQGRAEPPRFSPQPRWRSGPPPRA